MRQITYDENGDIITISDEKVIKQGSEIFYYVRSKSFLENGEEYVGGTLLLEIDSQYKTLFETEDDANKELNFILQDNMFEKGENITYSVVSVHYP